MTQTSISLPEDFYMKLKKIKRDNETLLDLIQRLLNEDEKLTKGHNIRDLEGAFGDDSDEWERIEIELYNDRLRMSSCEETKIA